MWKLLPGKIRSIVLRVTQAKFTISAAAVVHNNEGEVLLLNHAMWPGPSWGLPGGMLLSLEQPDDAIRREILEEAGIEIENLQLLRARAYGSHIEMVYTATAVGLPIISSREIVDLGWFGIDRLPAEMSPTHRKLLLEEM